MIAEAAKIRLAAMAAIHETAGSIMLHFAIARRSKRERLVAGRSGLLPLLRDPVDDPGRAEIVHYATIGTGSRVENLERAAIVRGREQKRFVVLGHVD